jgi:ketosteroid isomerase-like protein
VDIFYSGLALRDSEAMVACYTEDVVFQDPAFGELRGRDAADMWRMLCASDTDLTLEHHILEALGDTVRTNWIATYTFTPTGNSVRNDIEATMTFRDGKIVDHRDNFDMWKWSSQALGLPGKLLGWGPRSTPRSDQQPLETWPPSKPKQPDRPVRRGRPQRPFKIGVRFSRKARAPAAWSSVRRIASRSRRAMA